MGFTHRVPTRSERYGFFIVHGHAGKGNPNVMSRFEWVRAAIHPFRVDIDQPHHDGRQWVLQISFPGITAVSTATWLQPLLL